MKKWIILLIIIIASSFLYLYIFQNHRDIASEASSFQLKSETLISAFSINQMDSEKKYLNKTIEVVGTVSDINKNYITLDETIICLFNNLNSLDIVNKKIQIKGRFIGYDDLLEQVKLDQCTITNNIK